MSCTEEDSLILAIRKARGSKAKLKEVVHHGGNSLFFFLVLGKETQPYTYALNARNAKNLKMKEIVTVRFLGKSLPRNPGGIACYAYIIRNKEGHLLDESCGLAAEPNSPSSTNSVANYTALIRALEWLIKNRYSNDIIKVYGNSKLVISQINDGEVAAISSSNKNNISKNTLPLYTKVMKLKSKFYYVSFELNNDNVNRHIDDKEVEELSLLAYIEAKMKILKQSGSRLNNSNDKNRQELKKKLFSTAAELMMAAPVK